MTAGDVEATYTIKLAKEGKPGNTFQRNIKELDEIRAQSQSETAVGQMWYAYEK